MKIDCENGKKSKSLLAYHLFEYLNEQQTKRKKDGDSAWKTFTLDVAKFIK